MRKTQHKIINQKYNHWNVQFLQENEKSRDIIIEQRFHRTIIGAKGEKIREIKDKFNQVQVTFPDPGKKSDIVTLRGPKNDVDKCYKYLQNLQQEMVSKICPFHCGAHASTLWICSKMHDIFCDFHLRFKVVIKHRSTSSKISTKISLAKEVQTSER